ncbi:MAG TPA: DUF445 family protein [Thermoanaerobacterales bacterium]|nr:DUF445 family protein [Thermoanaerobacterales bacterium]
MNLNIIIMPTVGALIGWLTNWLAIKLIFRPHEPIMIPFMGIKIQGLIPKRRDEIASILGKTIEQELIPAGDILDKTLSPQAKREIVIIVKNSLLERLKNRINFLPSVLKGAMLNFAEDFIEKEIDSFVQDSSEEIIEMIKNKMCIGEIVEEKILSYELSELESIILKISSTELKHIELLGGIIGFIIGLGQFFMLYILR